MSGKHQLAPAPVPCANESTGLGILPIIQKIICTART